MFMGTVEGVEVGQDAARSLVDLSQMGSISTGEGEKLDVDFDNTRATVVEDPLAHIDQQILGVDYSEQAEATEQVDFAAAAGKITGESDFVSVDELQAEEAQGGPVTELFTAGQHTPNLPAPVRAVDAQGLDLTKIDSADVTDPAASTLASDSTGAVDSDSSEETAESAPETPAAAPGPDQEEDAQRFNFAGTVKQTDEAPSSDLAEVEQEAAATYSPETSEGRSTGAIVAVVGLLLLVLVLATVWFLFFR